MGWNQKDSRPQSASEEAFGSSARALRSRRRPGVLMRIIGFEGFAGKEVPLTFGAAAASDENDTVLVNLVTGFRSHMSKWARYVEERVVTVVPTFDLPEGTPETPCCVLRSRKLGIVADVLNVHLLPLKDIFVWNDDSFMYVLFPSFERLQTFASHVAPILLRRAAQEHEVERKIIEQQAYVLDHKLDPVWQSLVSGNG